MYRSVDNSELFQHISSYNLPLAPRLISWNQKAKIVAVGFETGDVMLADYDPAVNQTLFTNKVMIKVNNMPVTGVQIDEKKQILYAVTLGRKLKTV